MNRSINAKAQADMFKFVEKAKGKVQKLTRNVLHEIGYRLVMRSPIGDPSTWHPPYWPKGYKPGHFLNNWQLGIDKIPQGVIPGVVSGTGPIIARLAKVGRWPAGHVYYFVNNVPYAAVLEKGLHSPQVGPLGMVGLTTMEFPEIAKQAEANLAGGE